jgi:hypothetical protein
MEGCIVSDYRFNSWLVSPYAQDWRILLRYLLSRFSASGHATVPQSVSTLKSGPLS